MNRGEPGGQRDNGPSVRRGKDVTEVEYKTHLTAKELLTYASEIASGLVRLMHQYCP